MSYSETYDGKKWVPAIVMIVLLLIATGVVLGLMIPLEKGTYVNKFTESTDSTTMTRFDNSSLYPYSGTWDQVQTGKTIDQCISICVADSTCRGFFHHTTLSSAAEQDTCYFYRNNNVQSLVGTNVELSPYFVDTALVFGAELPGNDTNVYIKNGQAFKMFRSSFAEPTVI